MQFSILRRFWCTLSAVPLSIRARCCRGAVLSGRDRGGILKKSARSTPQKKYFFRVFSEKIFRAYILFPLLYQEKEKKSPLKIFWRKGLTRGYTRAIMETLQGGTPQDRRTASRDARTVRTVSTLRIVVAPADSIPRTGVGYSTPNVHAESRRGIGTCIACTTMSAGTVKTV